MFAQRGQSQINLHVKVHNALQLTVAVAILPIVINRRVRVHSVTFLMIIVTILHMVTSLIAKIMDPLGILVHTREIADTAGHLKLPALVADTAGLMFLSQQITVVTLGNLELKAHLVETLGLRYPEVYGLLKDKDS